MCVEMNADLLFDFWYVTVRCSKTAGWLWKTFPVYTILQDASLSNDVHILVVNTQGDMHAIRRMLSRTFCDEDAFDVSGEGYSVEMCLQHVRDAQDSLVLYTETLADALAQKHTALSRVIADRYEEYRVYTRSSYAPVEFVNHDLQAFLVATERNGAYFLDTLFCRAVEQYTRMLPLTSAVSAMCAEFAKACALVAPGKNKILYQMLDKHSKQRKTELSSDDAVMMRHARDKDALIRQWCRQQW